MADVKKQQYVAVRGIDFEGLKGKPHCEPGDPIPDGVKADTLKDLLECGDIKEAK